MRRVGMLSAVLVTLAGVGVARADGAGDLLVTDGCGDVSTEVVRVTKYSVATDPLGRASGYDIDRAKISSASGGGLDVSLTTCAPIPASSVFTGAWQVTAWLPGDCAATVYTTDDKYGAPDRVAYLETYCTVMKESPLGPYWETSTNQSMTLPASAWSIQGSTVTWHLSSSMLAQVEAAAAWSTPSAHTWDGARVTEMWDGNVAVNGPGTHDDAEGSGSISPS